MMTVRSRQQAGFTIIELLIATVIFSVILLVVTAAILQFSRQYYKGIIASSTQSAARDVIDDISRAVQFNGGDVLQLPPAGSGYCVGTAKRYSFAIGSQVTDAAATTANQHYHGLVSDTVTSCTTATPALAVVSLPADLSAPNPPQPTLLNPRELLGVHMRLNRLTIDPVSGSNGLYTISIRIVYGDDDLLCKSGDAADCNSAMSAYLTDPTADLICKPTVGSQYCAVSALTTTVKKRVI